MISECTRCTANGKIYNVASIYVIKIASVSEFESTSKYGVETSD